MKTNPKYYAVVAIMSGRLMYCGSVVAAAAYWLEPGTCWGEGVTRDRAILDAENWREKFLHGGVYERVA